MKNSHRTKRRCRSLVEADVQPAALVRVKAISTSICSGEESAQMVSAPKEGPRAKEVIGQTSSPAIVKCNAQPDSIELYKNRLWAESEDPMLMPKREDDEDGTPTPQCVQQFLPPPLKSAHLSRARRGLVSISKQQRESLGTCLEQHDHPKRALSSESISASSENQQRHGVHHSHPRPEDVTLKAADLGLVAHPGGASDAMVETSSSEKQRLSDKELKARRAERFPRRWQAEEQSDWSALDDLEEGKHGIAPLATPTSGYAELVRCETMMLAQLVEVTSPELAADYTGVASRRRAKPSHDNLREPFSHPDELEHCARRAARRTDSDYTNGDFQEVIMSDAEDLEVFQRESQPAVMNSSSRSSRRLRKRSHPKSRPRNWRTERLDGSAWVQADSGSLLEPISTPCFISHVEHNVERLCKLSTAEGVVAFDTPRIRHAAGYLWFCKDSADSEPYEGTVKQIHAEDGTSQTKRSFLARLCGCFRAKQREGQGPAPSA